MRLSLDMKPHRRVPEPVLLITVLYSLRLDTDYGESPHTHTHTHPTDVLEQINILMPISYLYFMMDFNQLSKMLFLNIWLRSEFQDMGVLMSGEEKEAIMVWGS